MVSQLIMEGGDRWNEDLVRGVFEDEDAEAILQISLKASQNEDYPFWFPDPKGNFSVRNAYRVWTTKVIGEKIEAGNSGHHRYRELESMQELWKKL